MKNRQKFIDLQKLNNDLKDHNLIVLTDSYDFSHIHNSIKLGTSNHFGCYYDTETKKLIKVYNKNLIWRRSGFIEAHLKALPFKAPEDRIQNEWNFSNNFDTNTPAKKSKYDAINWTVDIYKSKKYDFLPEIIFDTPDYIGIEWYIDGWRVLRPDDIVNEVLGLPVVTSLFKSTMKQIIEMQRDNTLDNSDTELMDILYTDYKSLADVELNNKLLLSYTDNIKKDEFIANYKPCIGICGLDSDDFMINAEGTQCKYVDLDNVNIMPRLNNTLWIPDGVRKGFCHPPLDIFNVDESIANIIYRGKRLEIRL